MNVLNGSELDPLTGGQNDKFYGMYIFLQIFFKVLLIFLYVFGKKRCFRSPLSARLLRKFCWMKSFTNSDGAHKVFPYLPDSGVPVTAHPTHSYPVSSLGWQQGREGSLGAPWPELWSSRQPRRTNSPQLSSGHQPQHLLPTPWAPCRSQRVWAPDGVTFP